MGILGQVVSRSKVRIVLTDTSFFDSYDIAEPFPSAMVESFRAFGYDTGTAIADLIDNSITAGASRIWLTFCWDGSDSWIAILDDGKGMIETELVNAMRLGSRNPLDVREPGDLGRFGLGLKTASFSQCRGLTVRTKVCGQGLVVRRWDLDYINQTGEWRLLHTEATGATDKLAGLEQLSSGTVVLLEKLDRVVGKAKVSDRKAHDQFLELIETVEKHLAMVFHRFLEEGSLCLWINGQTVTSWNPFLPDEKATQMLPEEIFFIGDEKLTVQPYILPHHSKIDQQILDKAAGARGWSAQQGFYIYRSDRLLVAGDWLDLGFQKEEHYRLARIQVDLPNTLDSSWDIDVKKSRARPPASLKSDFKRIARLTRQRAMEVYRHRGKVLIAGNQEDRVFPWEKTLRHGKVSYAINREHPIVREVLDGSKKQERIIQALLRLLEETVPVQQIWLDSASAPDCQCESFENTPPAEVLEVMHQVYNSLCISGLSPAQAQQRLMVMEPFQRFKELAGNLLTNHVEEL
jgi:Histidine kinase-, DNA gyrase B-, and HSP90-like ATPase